MVHLPGKKSEIPSLDPFVQKAQRTIARFNMLKFGDHVIVAVSGGPDSVCLLSALHALSKELGITLHVAHLNHMFRGKESSAEARFVADLAKQMDIPATIEQVDVPAFCGERGLSRQEGARLARYEFLQRVAKQARAARIATGHTADDQAETLLMRLIRGAGVTGLSAIPPVRENVIRPLIETTRDEVLRYAKTHNLAFVTDPSNAKPIYTRNRVRQDILPILKNFNPRIVETLASEAALLRDENEAMESCLATMVDGILSAEKDAVVLKRSEFNALPQAYKRRLLIQAVDHAGAEPSTLSLVQIEEALAFMATAQTGRAMRLPYGLTLEREYKNFRLSATTEARAISYPLDQSGITVIPELGIQVETRVYAPLAGGEENKNYLWQAAFDYDKISLPLTLRTRLRGDWFCPAGMGGRSRKLQDFFVDQKVPRQKRDAVPLLVSGNDILWVAGHRTDDRFLPSQATKNIVLITLKNRE
jgi:tRNA(Ile)-lysidine synthase